MREGVWASRALPKIVVLRAKRDHGGILTKGADPCWMISCSDVTFHRSESTLSMGVRSLSSVVRLFACERLRFPLHDLHLVTMPRNLARYEQFLRIYALLDILSNVRQPLDDQALISALKERLGLSRLSPRTLHRDCEFLVACGYPIDRPQLPGDRRHGWLLDKEASARRQFPGEPLTILELVAFNVARDLLRAFQGTILWTGIESLRSKITTGITAELLAQVDDARRVFHVEPLDIAKHASHPRLLSAISTAITDCREIEVESRDHSGAARHRIQPVMLMIRLPQVQLVGWSAQSGDDPPVVLDIAEIEKVTTLDSTFTPRPIDPAILPGR